MFANKFIAIHGWADIETSRGQSCCKVGSRKGILYDSGPNNSEKPLEPPVAVTAQIPDIRCFAGLPWRYIRLFPFKFV